MMVGWSTKHRGFKVDVMVPGETVARIVGRTFLANPSVSCQPNTLVNILCRQTCHLFHNVASPELLNCSMFLKTKYKQQYFGVATVVLTVLRRLVRKIWLIAEVFFGMFNRKEHLQMDITVTEWDKITLYRHLKGDFKTIIQNEVWPCVIWFEFMTVVPIEFNNEISSE